MVWKFHVRQSLIFYSTFSLLLILNIFLKISFLDTESLWYDESISVKTALLDFGHVKHVSEWDNNPPFYYYCLWVWTKLFGISEFSVRFLSVLFSAFATAFLFAFAKKFFNYQIALSAALIFTFHNLGYEYSHEARSYSLTVLLSVISTIFFFKVIEHPSFWNIFFLGLINFLIIYTHYISGLIIFLQVIFIVFIYRKALKSTFYALAIALAFTFLRFTLKQFILITSFNKTGSSFWLAKADEQILLETLQRLFGGDKTWVLLLMLLITSLAVLFFKKDTPFTIQKRALIYSGLCGVGSIVILFILGIFTPIFLDRYLLFTLPFLILPIAWLLGSFNKWLFVGVPLILLLQGFYLNFNPIKPTDFRMAASVVKNLREDAKTLTLVQTRDVTGLFAYYFDREIFIDQKEMSNKLKSENIYDFNTTEDFLKMNFKEDSLILCQTFENPTDSRKMFEILTKHGYVYVTSQGVRGIRISKLKKTH